MQITCQVINTAHVVLYTENMITGWCVSLFLPEINDALEEGLLTWAFAHCKYLCFRKLAPSVRRCVNKNCLPVK